MQGRSSRQEKALVVANHKGVVAVDVEVMVVEEDVLVEEVVVMQEAQRRKTRAISSVSSASRMGTM